MERESASQIPVVPDLRVVNLFEENARLEKNNAGLREHHVSHSLKIKLGGVTLAGIAALSFAAGLWKGIDRSGEYKYYQSTVQEFNLIDNELRVGSWNMHDETWARRDEIRKLMKQQRLDALLLQEVNASDAELLSTFFPDLDIVFGLADKKQQPLDGGYGNLLLSGQKMKAIYAKSLEGTGLLTSAARTLKGAFDDTAHADSSLSNTKAGLQESRQILAATIKVLTSEGYKDVRIVTSHISGSQIVHGSQFEGLLSFLKSDTSPGRLTVFCGDLNEEGTVALKFGKIGFITPVLERATSSSKLKIDHCAYSAAGAVALGHTRVLGNYFTDHAAIIYSNTFPLAPGIAPAKK